jgi:hypothetical protein
MRIMISKLKGLMFYILPCTSLVSRLRIQFFSMIFIPWLAVILGKKIRSYEKRKGNDFLMNQTPKEGNEEDLDLL